MKAIIKATAVLGGASVITILIGLVSSKVTAVLLGVAGFGLMALYQSLIGLVLMVAGLGIPTALTRALARALAAGDGDRAAALRRAGWTVTMVAALIAIALIALFSRQVDAVMLDSRGGLGWMPFILPAILLTMLASVQTSVINAWHRVRDLARIGVLTAALSLIPTIALVWFYRERGVAPALLAGTLINLGVVYAHYRRIDAGEEARAADRPAGSIAGAARELIGFGLPFMASLAVGAGVLTVLPLLILHRLGPEGVGLFRAASAIAVNYLGVILASMAQDYFPRVSRASEDASLLGDVVNDQLRLILLLAGPVILAMMGAVPYLIPILYSRAFAPAAAVLEWQLIGDLFKFATWAMGFVIMVRLGSRTFFLTELASGAVLLASSWYGMGLAGLPGLGMAFLTTGVAACAINWLVLYRHTGITWRRGNVVLFCLLAAAMLLLRSLGSAGLAWLILLGAATLATGFGLYSLNSILREFGGWKAVVARRHGMAHG